MFTALQLVNEFLSRFGEKEVSTIGETAESTLALRKLNLAQQMISTAYPFTWTQKNTPGVITAVAGTNIYTLATDVGRVIVAKHEYNGGGWIKFIDRASLEEYRSDRTQTTDRATPKFMTTAGFLQVSISDVPALRVELWPVPDTNFNSQAISYYYNYILSDISADSDISLIPGDFHWLIIEVAEGLYRRGPIRIGGDGAQSQIDLFTIAEKKAQEGLKDLISRDSVVTASEMAWTPDDPSI